MKKDVNVAEDKPREEHSQLPWKWHRRSAAGEHTGAIYMEKRKGHAYAIAMQPRYVEDAQWEDDAEFATKAVNCHSELVGALSGMVDMYTALINSGDAGNWNPEVDAEVIAARAALEKARG